jgi:hypothetical protein
MSSCFGLCFTQESSRQPRKQYNQLVPAVFPDEAPEWDSALDLAITRKIGNVEDYVEANASKIPKVSRRFARRILKESTAPAGVGQCKVPPTL